MYNLNVVGKCKFKPMGVNLHLFSCSVGALVANENNQKA